MVCRGKMRASALPSGASLTIRCRSASLNPARLNINDRLSPGRTVCSTQVGPDSAIPVSNARLAATGEAVTSIGASTSCSRGKSSSRPLCLLASTSPDGVRMVVRATPAVSNPTASKCLRGMGIWLLTLAVAPLDFLNDCIILRSRLPRSPGVYKTLPLTKRCDRT